MPDVPITVIIIIGLINSNPNPSIIHNASKKSYQKESKRSLTDRAQALVKLTHPRVVVIQRLINKYVHY